MQKTLYYAEKLDDGTILRVSTTQNSVVIILLIALFFRQFRHIEIVNNIFKGLRPVVVALIAVPVFNVAKKLFSFLCKEIISVSLSFKMILTL